MSIAEAVQIDKPTDGECAVHQNAPEGAVVTNSGHYAYASGTMYPFNWSSTPPAAVVWDYTPDQQYRHTVRFMIQPGHVGPVVIKVSDTGDGTSDTVTLNPVTLSWCDNWSGTVGGPGPDRLVNNHMGGLRGVRALNFMVVGECAVADLRIRTYANGTNALGRIEVLSFDGEPAHVEPVEPPCGHGEWRVTVPVSASPEGTMHTLTIRGAETSAFMDDIEVDLVARQVGAVLCYDGIGAVLVYSVVINDLTYNSLSEGSEADGVYCEASGAPDPVSIRRIEPANFVGTVRLNVIDPDSRLDVWSAAGEPLPLPKDVAANLGLPFPFQSRAIKASASVRDLALYCEPIFWNGQEAVLLGGGTCRDEIKITGVMTASSEDLLTLERVLSEFPHLRAAVESEMGVSDFEEQRADAFVRHLISGRASLRTSISKTLAGWNPVDTAPCLELLRSESPDSHREVVRIREESLAQRLKWKRRMEGLK